MSKVNAEIKYCHTVDKFCPTNDCHLTISMQDIT